MGARLFLLLLPRTCPLAVTVCILSRRAAAIPPCYLFAAFFHCRPGAGICLSAAESETENLPACKLCIRAELRLWNAKIVAACHKPILEAMLPFPYAGDLLRAHPLYAALRACGAACAAGVQARAQQRRAPAQAGRQGQGVGRRRAALQGQPAGAPRGSAFQLSTRTCESSHGCGACMATSWRLRVEGKVACRTLPYKRFCAAGPDILFGVSRVASEQGACIMLYPPYQPAVMLEACILLGLIGSLVC